jgi:hypothetical protein
MYQGTKVCRAKDSCRCNLWPWQTNEDFSLIFGGKMYRGIKVCHVEESCRCDIWPWPCDLETGIPFRSVSPNRMKIFGWYLVWGCITGQWFVTRKISVDATFDVDPKLHNNSLPLCIFETNEDFWLIFGGRMYQWTKMCVTRKNRVDATFDLDPVTLKPKFPSALYFLKEWATLHITHFFDYISKKQGKT